MESGAKATVHFHAGSKALLTQKWEFAIDKSTKVTFTDQVDVMAVFTDPKNAAMKMGFAVEYKL